MSYYSDIFKIYIQGPKGGVIRMLNAAICHVGMGCKIAERDSIDLIIKKTRGANGKYGLRVSVIDLMDEQCLQDIIIQEKKLAFENKIKYLEDVAAGKVSFASEEEEEYAAYDASEKLENMCNGRFIDIGMISKTETGLEVFMDYYVGEESFSYPDWAGWDDVCRLYGCKVVIDDDEYRNGVFSRFCGTDICEMKDGSVQKTRIEPERGFQEYVEAWDTLVKLSPKRYSKKMVADIEVKIRELQDMLSREKLLIQLARLDETNGRLDVPEGVIEVSDVLWKYREKLKSICIPASVDTINKIAIAHSNIESIEISPENPYFCSVNNCILNKEKTKLRIGCKGSVIPDGIVEIEDSASSGCDGLQSIIIPPGTKQKFARLLPDNKDKLVVQ